MMELDIDTSTLSKPHTVLPLELDAFSQCPLAFSEVNAGPSQLTGFVPHLPTLRHLPL